MMRHLLILILSGGFLMPTLIAQSFQEELGKAGYYADKYQGQKTASGALYDKAKFTCAHKKLPMGARIRVTNLENQKSVIVEVNDRGPFKDGFIVDLSRAAAESIGMIRAGVVRVRIEPVDAAALPAAGRQSPPPTDNKLAPEAPRVPNANGIRVLKAYNPLSNGAKSGDASQPAAYAAAAERPKPKMVTPKAVPMTQRDPSPQAYSTEPQPQTPPQPADKIRELYQVGITRPAKEGYAVQLAVLGNIQNGMEEAGKLEAGFPDMVLVLIETENTENPNAPALFKIMLGPYYDKAGADNARAAAAKKGYRKAFVVNLAEM
jgi:rare lipoprotein A